MTGRFSRDHVAFARPVTNERLATGPNGQRATGPNGQRATVTDNVIAARRLAP